MEYCHGPLLFVFWIPALSSGYCDLIVENSDHEQNTLYDPNPKGALYVFDYLTGTDLREIELIGFPEQSDFHPLGINIFRDPGRLGSKDTTLFVVNHQRNGSTIEIFTLSPTSASAQFLGSTFPSPNLYCQLHS